MTAFIAVPRKRAKGRRRWKKLKEMKKMKREESGKGQVLARKSGGIHETRVKDKRRFLEGERNGENCREFIRLSVLSSSGKKEFYFHLTFPVNLFLLWDFHHTNSERYVKKQTHTLTHA